MVAHEVKLFLGCEQSAFFVNAKLLIVGSLEVKGPTIWTVGKAQPGRSRASKKLGRGESQKIRDGESQKREDAGLRKGRKVAKICVFQMICGPGG